MHRKVIERVFAVCVLTLALSVPLRAQVAGASLSGTITDASAAAVANAKISVKNLATDVITTSTTNTDGFYSVPNLLPGDYQVTISAPGFGTKVAPVTLTVGAKQTLDLSLIVGQAQQVVEVREAAPAIQLATSTISDNVEGEEVRELPLNGRDWGALATLQPGVTQVRTQVQVSAPGGAARGLGMQLSIGGGRPTQNTYRLNGVIINDYSNAGPGSVLGQNLGVDAIQEFSVLTSDYSAEYGFTSGGVINAITRSGTNQFHGSAYEFLRNSALDAADFFENSQGLKKAEFRRNQFGASAGGPIWKDKVFIFGDYEGLRQSKGISHTAHVPSPTARQGILNCTAQDVASNTFGCTSIQMTHTVPVDPEIAKFFTFFPAVNAGLISPDPSISCSATPALCSVGNYAFSGAQVVPENYYTFRSDVKISDKDSLNGSYFYDHSSFTQPDSLNQALDQFVVGRQGISLEETHIFSPSLSNTVRIGYSRSIADGQLTPKAINPAAADSSFAMAPGFFAPRITAPSGITGFQGGLRGQSVQLYTQQSFQGYDDAVRNIGTHNLKFGGALMRYHDDLFAPFTEDGSASFSTYSNFLQNIPFRVGGPTPVDKLPKHYNRDWIVGAYVQDDWKILHNLTLNLGLRYEMATIPTEIHGHIANLPTIETNPNTGPFNNVYFTHNPTLKNFEPRIGFAWDPFHDGKTALRGGFGLFDALPLPYQLIINNAQTAPFIEVGTIVNPPQGSFPHGIVPLLTSPPASALSWNYVDTNIKRNYVYQYNLNVQRQITPSTTLTIAYAGSRGIHNPFQLDDINTVFPFHIDGRWVFPNPVCSTRPAPACQSQSGPTIVPGNLINPNVSVTQTTIWQSMSYYNALQVRVAKQMSHGLQMTGSFTWSKTMDTSSGSTAGDNFSSNVTPTIPWWDLRIVRGLSDFNVGRNLVISVLYEVPTPAAFGGPMGFVTKGWQIGTILEASDGVPLWPLDGLEGDPMGQLNSEPLAIPDRLTGGGCNSLINPGNPNQYIKAQCLVNAQAPSQAFYAANCDKSFPFPTCINLLGNLGRNTIIGPGLVNVDFSAVKNTKIPRISETFNVQFRAEFFNVLNHPNFAPPINNLEAIDATGSPVPGFGQITNLQVPSREIQFALKFIW
jgi:outer membrane receptor protein involved in Fe transport